MKSSGRYRRDRAGSGIEEDGGRSSCRLRQSCGSSSSGLYVVARPRLTSPFVPTLLRPKVTCACRQRFCAKNLSDHPTPVNRGREQRPGGAALLNVIRSGSVGMVMSFSIDRAGRTLVGLVAVLEACGQQARESISTTGRSTRRPAREHSRMRQYAIHLDCRRPDSVRYRFLRSTRRTWQRAARGARQSDGDAGMMIN
jgi:hypothetical protein